MDEEIKKIKTFIWRFIGWMAGTMVFFWLLCYIVTYEPPKEPWKARPPEEVWKGYDPSRPVTDISELDYKNMRVTYRTYPKPGEKAPPMKIYGKYRQPSKGIKITDGNGRIIDTGLTYEELFEQLNLEYEDLYEHYMD